MSRRVLGLLAITALPALAQSEPPTVSLPAAKATLDVEFTRVAGLRELSDGRVLVTDAAERRLLVVDWATGSARQIGREGQGPGEYASLGALLALGGDSTLLVDRQAGRWLVLHRDSVVETVAADAPAIRGGARFPIGADARGFVYATRSIARDVGAGGLPMRIDSTLAVRIARHDGAQDTLAVMAARPSRINTSGTRGRVGFSVEIVSNPLAAGDQLAAFADGWVAIARVNPYRVDWVAPDGALQQGAPLPFQRQGVDEREKRSVLQREADQRGGPPRDPEAVADWPAILPPFVAGALTPAPDGRLWIKRLLRAGNERTTYEVVDRRGVLVARLTMRADEHLEGFGLNSLYTVLTDADGLQWLRRHPLPRF